MRSASSPKSFGLPWLALALGRGGDARDQMIDGGGERRDFRMIGVQLDAPAEAAADRDALQLLRQLSDRLQLAALEPVQNQEKRRDEPEQKAQQPQDRHLVFLNAPS